MEFNFVVENSFLKEGDFALFFGEEKENIPNLQMLHEEATVWDVLVMANIFPSKSQARKDARFKNGEIEKGMTELVVGKKKTKIFIFKPFRTIYDLTLLEKNDNISNEKENS